MWHVERSGSCAHYAKYTLNPRRTVLLLYAPDTDRRTYARLTKSIVIRLRLINRAEFFFLSRVWHTIIGNIEFGLAVHTGTYELQANYIRSGGEVITIIIGSGDLVKASCSLHSQMTFYAGSELNCPDPDFICFAAIKISHSSTNDDEHELINLRSYLSFVLERRYWQQWLFGSKRFRVHGLEGLYHWGKRRLQSS